MKEKILEFLGEIVAYGGGATVIAYLTFTFLGKKLWKLGLLKSLKSLNTI
jgi:hypothetical protein